MVVMGEPIPAPCAGLHAPMNQFLLLLGIPRKKYMQTLVMYSLIFSIIIGTIIYTYSGWPWYGLVLTSPLFIYVYLYQDYRDKVSLRYKQKQVSLMQRFAFLKVLLMQQRNTYQAWKDFLAYVPQSLKPDIETFVMRLQQDQSITPYLDLAKIFQSLIIEQVLLAIYQLEIQGGNLDYFRHVDYIFEQIDQRFYQQYIRGLEQKLGTMQQYIMVVTGFITFSLLVGVIQIIGGLISGI